MSRLTWLLFLGAVLLGVTAWYRYDTYLIAFATGFLLSLKSLQLVTVLAILRVKVLQFLFIKIPQKFLTWLAKRYIISEATYQRIVQRATQLKTNWREHLSFRFVVYMVLSLVLLSLSVWQFGLWLFLFYEVDQVISAVLRYLAKWLEGSLLHRLASTTYRWFLGTRLGVWFTHVDERAKAAGQQAEELGISHRLTVRKVLRTWLYIATGYPQMPILVLTNPVAGVTPQATEVAGNNHGKVTPVTKRTKRVPAPNPAIKR